MQSPSRQAAFEKYRQSSNHNSHRQEKGVFRKQFLAEDSEQEQDTPPQVNSAQADPPQVNLPQDTIQNQNKVIFQQQEEIQYWKSKYGELQQHSHKQEEDINYLNIVIQNYQNMQLESTIKPQETKILQSDQTLNLEHSKDKEDKDYQIRNLQAQCADYFKTIQQFQATSSEEKQRLYDEVDNLKNWNVTSQNQRIQFLQKIQQLISPLTPQFNLSKMNTEQLKVLLDDSQNRLFEQIKELVDHKCPVDLPPPPPAQSSLMTEQQLIEIRNGYEKKCIEYSRFIQKQLNTLYKNFENSKQVQASLNGIQNSLKQQFNQFNQTQQMVSSLQMSHQSLRQSNPHPSLDYPQNQNRDNYQQVYQPSHSSQLHSLSAHKGIESSQNLKDQPEDQETKHVSASRMVLTRELDKFTVPLRGLLMVQLIGAKDVQSAQEGKMQVLVRLNQLEKKSRVFQTQDTELDEQFRFDILIKKRQELPQVKVELQEEDAEVGKAVITQSEINEVVGTEGVWFRFEKRLEGAAGHLEWQMMFVNQEVAYGFSQGQMDPLFDSLRQDYFPLKQAKLVVSLQSVQDLRSTFNENNLIHARLTVASQQESTISVPPSRLEWNNLLQFQVDILRDQVPSLDIGFYHGEPPQSVRLFARLSAFPIESLITRPGLWVSYRQDILSPDGRTVLGLVLFKMVLLVDHNYTDHQNGAQKTFQNVQSTKSLLMQRASNKTSNNTSYMDYSAHKVHINNTDHMANKPRKKQAKSIRFALDEPSQDAQDKAKQMKKQQLAQSKYTFQDTDQLHQTLQQSQQNIRKSVQFRQSLASFSEEEPFAVTGKLLVTIEQASNIKVEDQESYYMQLVLSDIVKDVLQDSDGTKELLTLRTQNKEGPNPVWNQQFTFNLHAKDTSQLPTLTLELFSFNRVSNDQFMGGIKNIDILECIQNPDEVLSATEAFSLYESQNAAQGVQGTVTFDICYTPQG